LLIIAAWIEDGGYEWVNAIININYQTKFSNNKMSYKVFNAKIYSFWEFITKT
jgi:hypothetical protein